MKKTFLFLYSSPIDIVTKLIESLTIEKSQPQASEYAYEEFKTLFSNNTLENADKELFKSLKNVIGSSSRYTSVITVPIKT